jgi:hypothetical protein
MIKHVFYQIFYFGFFLRGFGICYPVGAKFYVRSFDAPKQFVIREFISGFSATLSGRGGNGGKFNIIKNMGKFKFKGFGKYSIAFR